MPPTQTPAVLTNVWSVAHGLSAFFQEEFLLVEPGLMLAVGAQSFTLGVTAVVFDDATGEPLDFNSVATLNVGTSPLLLGVWHFPAESCIVIAGYDNDLVSPKMWARRVYYDSAGNITTPDPLVTWSPGITGTGAHGNTVGVVSSSSLHAMVMSGTSCKTTDLDLVAGTVGTVNTHTLASIFGGSIDRTQLGLPLIGDHVEASMIATAYVNSAGLSTAQTYRVEFTAGTPIASLLSTSRVTGGGPQTPEGDRTYFSLTGLGGSNFRLADPSGLFLDVIAPDANFIFAKTPRSPYTGTGKLDSHNREDLTYGTVSGSNDKRRVREWVADSGDEVFAWEYPNSIGNHPITGRLVKRGQFWFGLNTSIFNVYEGDYPLDTWFVGFIGDRA